MLNKVILMGRLTADPELRYTQTSIPVASFTLAVDRSYSKEEKVTDFIDIVAWRNTAEFVSKWFQKGRMAVVSGRLQVRNWTDKEGGKRRSYEVLAEEVFFGEPKRGDDGPRSPGPSQYTDDDAPPQRAVSGFADIGDDEELPF